MSEFRSISGVAYPFRAAPVFYELISVVKNLENNYDLKFKTIKELDKFIPSVGDTKEKWHLAKDVDGSYGIVYVFDDVPSDEESMHIIKGINPPSIIASIINTDFTYYFHINYYTGTDFPLKFSKL